METEAKCPNTKQRRGRHTLDSDDGYTYTCSCGCVFEWFSGSNYYIINEPDVAQEPETFYVQRIRQEPSTAEMAGNIVFLIVGVISMAMIGALAIKLMILP